METLTVGEHAGDSDEQDGSSIFNGLRVDLCLLTGATGCSSWLLIGEEASSFERNFLRKTEGLFWMFLTSRSQPSVMLSLELRTSFFRNESLLWSLLQGASSLAFAETTGAVWGSSGLMEGLLTFSLNENLNLGLEDLLEDDTRSLKLCLIFPSFLRDRKRESSSLSEGTKFREGVPPSIGCSEDLHSLSLNVWRLERAVSTPEPFIGHLLSSRVPLELGTTASRGVLIADRRNR